MPSNTVIKGRGRVAVISTRFNQESMKLMRDIPDRRKWVGSSVEFEPSCAAIAYVEKTWPDATWDEGATTLRDIARRMNDAASRVVKTSQEFIPKMKSFEHQAECFELCKDAPYYGLLMEQGTGKSKVLIDNAVYLFSQDKVDAMLVIAKNGVHTNWVTEELPKHVPNWCKYVAISWDSKKGEKALRPLHQESNVPMLRVLTVNVEGLSTARAVKVCKQFLMTYRCIAVLDESTQIKTPKAARTKNVQKLGLAAPYRRIATGTPYTKSPLDIYSQMEFLSEDILGHSSFYSFRNEYAVMIESKTKKDRRGNPIKFVGSYKNLDRLTELVQKFTYRKTKAQCLDLPPKLYSRRQFVMSDEQTEHYINMDKKFMTQFQGRTIAAPLAMTRAMRKAQIACNYLPSENPKLDPGVRISDKNPRLEALMSDLEVLKDAEGKTIIFSPWRAALRDIWAAIVENYGEASAVAYSGQIKDKEERTRRLKTFRENDKVQWLVAQTDSIAYGHTLTEAAYVYYYANDYDFEIRSQSEDRAHRIGQTRNVLYTDMEAVISGLVENEETVDHDIIENLKSKRELADQLNRDEIDATYLQNKLLELDKQFLSRHGYVGGN